MGAGDINMWCAFMQTLHKFYRWMYAWIYRCVYAWIYVSMHLCVSLCVYSCMYLWMICIYISMHACIYEWDHVYICVCMYAYYVYARIHVYICMYVFYMHQFTTVLAVGDLDKHTLLRWEKSIECERSEPMSIINQCAQKTMNKNNLQLINIELQRRWEWVDNQLQVGVILKESNYRECGEHVL